MVIYFYFKGKRMDKRSICRAPKGLGGYRGEDKRATIKAICYEA